MYLTIFLILVYVLIALAIVYSLLVNGIRPSKTLAWLLAIFTIPVGGILLYLMLGRNQRKRKLTRRKSRALQFPELDGKSLSAFSSSKYKKLMKLVTANCHFPPTSNNKVQMLKDGKTTFDSIFTALEAARSYIHMQYYIFEEGDLADRLLALFDRKVRQGVVVRLIYDGIGSYSLSRSYIRKLQAAGVEVYSFLPFRFGRFLTGLNYRNHRKIIVVDGETGFTGGINVSDKYLKGDTELGMWHDMHLELAGPSVKYLDYVFAHDWFLVSEKKISQEPHSETDNADTVPKLVQVVYSGPDNVFPNIEQLYFSIISRANEYVYITNPYIIPSQEILKALQVASLGGVDVRLMISRKSDSRLVKWSVQSYFEPLLKSGVRIFLFPDGFLHSKIMVSDNDICSIGTANIDVRSFEHNYEVNAIVYDKDFSIALRDDFTGEIGRCKELTYEQHLGRPASHRLMEGIARVFTPLL
jgi:cardiolipin synthase